MRIMNTRWDTLDFSRPLIQQAFIHPSCRETKANNQRLEFFGDAILDFIVSEYLFSQYPDKNEGELTKIRAHIVNESALYQKAIVLHIGEKLKLGRGEDLSQGREKPSILADAMESLFGAIYLEYGLATVKEIIMALLKADIDYIVENKAYHDFKTLLQEKIQTEDSSALIGYKTLGEQGPDHDKTFLVGLFINETFCAQGQGKTKKEAEQKAAHVYLKTYFMSSEKIE